MELHLWKQSLDGRLVDDLVFKLGHHGVCEGGHLSEHLLIASSGIELQDEVTALGSDDGGVGKQLKQDSYVSWVVGLFVVLDIHLIETPADVVGVFHV